MLRILLHATVALAIAAATISAPLAGATNHDPIQPGDQVNGNCTLNFVFDGVGARAGKVYIGTAAHCVTVGQSSTTAGNSNFGTVVYRGDWDGERNGIPGSQLDFALIEVRPAFHANVLAQVKGHPGLPTGSTTSATTAAGDLMMFSGYGTGFGITAVTREERVGVLTHDNGKEYKGYAPIIFGDSGGPVLHGSGKALGIVSRLETGCCRNGQTGAYDAGPTIEGILAEMAPLGYPLALRTA